MKPQIYIVALAGLLVLTIVIWKIGFVHSDIVTEETTTSVYANNTRDQSNSDLEARMKKIEMDNNRMRREIYTIESQNSSQSDDNENIEEPDNEPAPILSPEEQAKQAKIIDSQILATMANALAEQEEDPHWSQEAYSVFEKSLVENELQGTQIDEIQCKASLCRMEFSHDGTQDFESFRSYGLKGEMLSAGFYFSYDVDTNVSTVYVAKQGHSLPPPPETISLMQ